MLTACSLWAHLAYLYKNVVPVQLNYRTVSTLLVSQIFLNVNYRFDAEVKAGTKAVKRKDQVEQLDEQLGFPQTEIFDLFQKHRRKVSHPTHQSHPVPQSIQSHPSHQNQSNPITLPRLLCCLACPLFLSTHQMNVGTRPGVPLPWVPSCLHLSGVCGIFASTCMHVFPYHKIRIVPGSAVCR